MSTTGIKLDSTIWALLFTALAYAIAFKYEAGYAQHFGIAEQLVEVKLDSFTRSLLVLLSITVSSFIAAEMLSDIFERTWDVTLPRIVKALIVSSMVLTFAAWLTEAEWHAWIPPGGFALLALTAMIYCRFSIILGSTYRERLAHFDENVGISPPWMPQQGWFAVVVGLSALVLVRTAEDAGRTAAKNQVVFLVANTPLPCVVIRTYGEAMICGLYSGSKPIAQYRFLPMQDRDLNFVLTQLGPLRAVPKNIELMSTLPTLDNSESDAKLSQPAPKISD